MSKKKYGKNARRWVGIAVTFTIFLVTVLWFLVYANSNGAKREGKVLEVRYSENGERKALYVPDTPGQLCVFYVTEEGDLWIDLVSQTKPENGVYNIKLPGKVGAIKEMAEGYEVTFYELPEDRAE